VLGKYDKKDIAFASLKLIGGIAALNLGFGSKKSVLENQTQRSTWYSARAVMRSKK